MAHAEFVNTQEAIKDTHNQAARTARHSVLDPLLEKLAHFNTSEDLSNKIHLLYQMLDADDNGTVSYREMTEGLERLTRTGGLGTCFMTPEEFEAMAARPGGGSLLDAAGGMSAASFDTIIRQHLHVYVQRRLALGSLWEEEKSGTFSSAQAMMQGLKMLFLMHAHDGHAACRGRQGASEAARLGPKPLLARGDPGSPDRDDRDSTNSRLSRSVPALPCVPARPCQLASCASI
jgi:hypothetical protein